GQYFDAEDNLHQNWFRDYDPTIGRYIESDPIGLGGGLNTYAYVDNSPMRWRDPTGLAKFCCRLLNSVVGKVFGQRHCYVVANDGTVYGLYPENGIGVPRTNDPRQTTRVDAGVRGDELLGTIPTRLGYGRLRGSHL